MYKQSYDSLSYLFLCNYLASTQELEPLCTEEKIEKYEMKRKPKCRLKFHPFSVAFCLQFNFRKSELDPVKRAVRPFSQYAYDIKLKNALTEKENFGFTTANNENNIDNKTLVNGGNAVQKMWYRDVVELRKKAEEYKVREIISK